jgi:uncharacterized integral membrane protein
MSPSPSFEITKKDIRSVQVYRGGIVLTALAFVVGTSLLFYTEGWKSLSSSAWLAHHRVLVASAVGMVIVGTGVSVLTIHLYIRQFHMLLKILYGIGLMSVAVFLVMAFTTPQRFLEILYKTPYGIVGFGFILAALCGIAVKEAFCFGQIEAVLFAVVTPLLVLGHLFQIWSPAVGFILLCLDTLLLCIFAAHKEIMPPDLDIGDKSVYMKT